MRRAIPILLAFVFAAPAQAEITYQFGPQVGPSKPGPQSRWGYRGTSHSKPTGQLNDPRITDRCQFLRGEYRLHHMFDGKPQMLKPFHGCKLWQLDHAYHVRIDSLKRAAEMATNPAVAAVSRVELFIIQLTQPE